MQKDGSGFWMKSQVKVSLCTEASRVFLVIIALALVSGCRQKQEESAKKAGSIEAVQSVIELPMPGQEAKKSPEKVSIVEVLRSANEEAVEEEKGGGPMSKTTAARLSSRWMQGKHEERVKAILSANLGSRALPQELLRLANQGSEESLQTLLMLSRERSGVSEVALSALSMVSEPALKSRAAEELARRVNDSNVSIAVTAMKGCVVLKGDAGLNEARQYMAQNYRRQDGYGEYVCSELVAAVGKLKTEAANAVLIDELKGVFRSDWMPDYGSKVVMALGKAGAGRALSPSVKMALEEYAQELQRKRPGSDNPPGRQYFDEKIAEVNTVLTGKPISGF